VTGVVFILMNMSGIEKPIARLELGHTGYATIISQQGKQAARVGSHRDFPSIDKVHRLGRDIG
jgi:hypothetical protein